VEFGGVGNPPDDWSHVGHCSQYAVFRRCLSYTPQTDDEILSAISVYEQVSTSSTATCAAK